MVNVTIAVPPQLKEQLDKHPEMNWSEVARQAWIAKLSNLEKLQLLNELTKNSKATDEDIEELATLMKKGIAEWHNKKIADMKKK